jgi:diguanylate cyclase (GGDEF)-like protein
VRTQARAARTTPGEPQNPAIRRSWWFLSITFALLGVVALLILVGRPGLLEFLLIALVLAAAIAAALHRRSIAGVELERRAEAESFARIFQGLSRSVSSDAIVGAIVEELALGTGADHVAVVRRRADARVLEATLVSSRRGVPAAIAQLPIGDLDDPLEDLTPRTGASLRPGWERRAGLGTLLADGRRTLLIERGVSTAAGRASAQEGSPPTADGGTSPSGADGGDANQSIDGAADGRLPTATSGEDTAPAPSAPGSAPDRARRSPALDDATAQRVADRIALKVGELYGLKNAVAAPLRTDEGVIGAIVLSRRTADPWSPPARRLLAGASVEASAALARANSYREAQALASTDALTGLPNRRYFDDIVALLSRRRRAEDAVAILMIDIDEFKEMNDRFGHDAGDTALRAVASAIAGTIRGDDVPARFGGDEFIILLRNAQPGSAVEVGERVARAVRGLDLGDTGIPAITVSIGVAVAETPDLSIPDLLKRADRALYNAKRGGRDRVVEE